MKKIMMNCFLLASGVLLFIPLSTKAVQGLNADDARIKIYTEQGDDWFRAITTRANKEGVVEVKDVLPGWYRMEIDEDNVKNTQYLGVRLRMLDKDGKRLNEETSVDLYVKLNGDKIFIGKIETDERGWLETEGLVSGYEYKLEFDKTDSASLHEKEGSPRVKVKAKIRDSEWFNCFYERTNDAKVLEVRDVLPGYYKFSYKKGDRDPRLPFILSARFRDEDGDRLKEPTPIKISVYQKKDGEDVRIPVGIITTNHRGEANIPGVMTEMKYKVEVLAN
jgi:hypothetical protein